MFAEKAGQEEVVSGAEREIRALSARARHRRRLSCKRISNARAQRFKGTLHRRATEGAHTFFAT